MGYSGYKARCAELERELAALQERVGRDDGEVTIRWLLQSADALLGAARLVINLRLDESEQTEQISELPKGDPE